MLTFFNEILNTVQSDIKIYTCKFLNESNNLCLFLYFCPRTSIYTPYIRFGENRRIRKKNSCIPERVSFGEFCLFFSHLYIIFERETKQAFWIHLTA